MTTSNTAEQKSVIGKKELRSIFLRSLSLEYSWNYERQQNMGYCFAMLPAIKKIYQKKEDQIAAAKRHMEFFNTTPYISTAVFGISTAMEESNARNEDFDTSSINNVRPLMDRVKNFSEKVTKVINIFDTKEVELPFKDAEYRKIVSPMIMYAITERLSCHLEKERNHPLTTRRYYRQMEY